MHTWMHARASARGDGVAAEPALMQAIIRYLEVFPAALHHPKEEKHLFSRLRDRTSLLNAELDELERQHERDRQFLADLSRRVAQLSTPGADAVAATRELEDAVQAYAAFLWDHLGREEGVILPAAQQHLTAADWSEIDAAFAENQDPRFAGETAKEYQHLFSRIVNAAKGWK